MMEVVQKKKIVAKQLFCEKSVTESQTGLNGEPAACLTLQQYQDMDNEEKSHVHNRVRQWSLKARSLLPSDHGIFCLVVSHLLKNAHRYFHMERPSDIQNYLLENQNLSSEMALKDIIGKFQEANKKVREAGGLKCKNRIGEQQKLVSELKSEFHTYRNMASWTGISLKTVHNWCAPPKPKVHKSTALSKLRKDEYERFLMQDTISFFSPSKEIFRQEIFT